MATALREVLARFGVSFDATELKKGDKAVDGLADKLKGFAGLLAGGLIVNAVKNMVFGLAEQADHLAKQSAALGLSTTELQSWQHAAGLSGVESEALTAAFARLQKGSAEAASGQGPVAEAFQKLGIKVKDAAGQLKGADALMSEAGAAIGAIKNPTERTATAMAVFGKSGAKLLPLFAEGADGMAKLRAEVEELGGGFSPEFAKRSEEMNDSVSRLNLAWTSFKVRMAGLVIPTINRFVMLATKVTTSVMKWVDATGILKENSHLAASAAVVLGLAFFRSGVKAILPWLPMIAALAAAVLLVDELITLWKGGDTIIGRAIDNVFGAGSSQKVVTLGKDILFMFEQSGRTADNFYRVVDGVWRGIVLSASIAWEILRKGWMDVGNAMYDALDVGRAKRNAAIDEEIAQAKVNAAAGSGNPEAKAEWLKQRIAALEATKERSRTEIGEDESKQNAQKLIDEYDRIAKQFDPKILAARADAEASTHGTATSRVSEGTITQKTEINITVPPGTPAQLPRAIGEAAAAGVKAGNRATKNAVVFKGG